MERCLDCNSVLTSKEKVCPACGMRVGHVGPGPTEILARTGTIIFYSAILAFLAARFAPDGTNFVAIISICAAIVLVIMRKKIFTR